MSRGPRLVFFVGTTASGKSSLALQLAPKWKAEIINGDSLQVYEGLDIGTAKPTVQERARVPHHLFDVTGAPNTLNAGDYRRLVLQLLESPTSENKIFFIVGASGFYLRALFYGMHEMPPTPEAVKEATRREIESLGVGGAHKKLAQLDPTRATQIHPNDSYRIQRALEILAHTGRKPSEIETEFEGTPFPYFNLWLGVTWPREALRLRVQQRVQHMMRDGFLDEVKRFRDRGFQHWPPLQSIGYQEIQDALDGKISSSTEALEELIVTHTMQLAKRQTTWFKREKQIQWFEGDCLNQMDLFLRSKGL